MSTAPSNADSRAINAGHLDQSTPDHLTEIEVECRGARVIVKPALDPRELQAAFRFLYEVYVEHEKLVSVYNLLPNCQASRSKWDKWDCRPSTRHIIAIHDLEIVGHARLLYRKDGRLPLEENGFSISSDEGDECEVSKLVVHPDFRRSQVLAAFYWHIFRICRSEQHLKSVIFSAQPKHESLYARIGAEPIGSFLNTELKIPCTVMRITFVDEYYEQSRGGLLGSHHGKVASAIVPSPEILATWASQTNSPDGSAPPWSAYRLDGKETDNSASVWRVVAGGKTAIAKVIRNTAEQRKINADRETAAYQFLNSQPVTKRLYQPKLLGTYSGGDVTTLLFEDMENRGEEIIPQHELNS